MSKTEVHKIGENTPVMEVLLLSVQIENLKHELREKRLARAELLKNPATKKAFVEGILVSE